MATLPERDRHLTISKTDFAVDDDFLAKEVERVSKLVDSRGSAVEEAKSSYWGMNAIK